MQLQQRAVELENKILQLQPLTDEQLQQQIDAGADAQQLIEQEARNTIALRLAKLELKSVNDKLNAERKAEAGKQIASGKQQREKIKADAVESLKRMIKAMDALESELAVFDGLSEQAATLAHHINRLSRESAQPEPIRNDHLTSPLFHALLQRCHGALERRRSTIYKELIEV
ncbi:hypothetical protein [Alishewanella longhuensis]